VSSWIRPFGIVVALGLAGLLIAGALGAPYRALLPPEDEPQPRVHLQTKNTSRFAGQDAGEVGRAVAAAVYPPGAPPDVVLLYDPADWLGGLQAAPLLRPLNAVLLPTSAADAVTDLDPAGSDVLDGASIVTLGSATGPAEAARVDPGQVRALLESAGRSPRGAVLVDPDDPATALLAAPWAVVSGDLVVTDAAAAGELPLRALGSARADGATIVDAGAGPATAVAFASFESEDATFGWAFNAETDSGYRGFVLANPEDPGMALLSANLARRGKPGPLLWTSRDSLPDAVDTYLWSQRAAFFAVPNEGPFHHVFVLGGESNVSFVAQAQADYALEIGPYRMKGPGIGGMDLLAAAWVALGIGSAAWVASNMGRYVGAATWAMRLAWPLFALMLGPFGIPIYLLAYRRPVIRQGQMTFWERPLWLQAVSATVSSVGFGGALMVTSGFILTLFGIPLLANELPVVFWLGAPMVVVMITSYIVAVLITWLLYQTPMLSMFHGRGYVGGLLPALPVVLASMAAVSLGMFPGMWLLMMIDLPMMPSEESILWFGVMFVSVSVGFVLALLPNYVLVRRELKTGLM